jgi:integrase
MLRLVISSFLSLKPASHLAPTILATSFNAGRDAGLPPSCHFHGLRYSAAKMLAEAGCTPHQIAAITCHATLAMVQKYSKAAEQKRLATEAMAKLLENARAT